MTALVTPRISASAGHILIVSVGRYDGELDPLPGAHATAKRLADFWRSSTLPEGREIGSLELLVSCDQPLVLPGENGEPETIAPARYAAVGQALKDWADRCRHGSFGVLHWIGHGETIQRASEFMGVASPVLYTEDVIAFGDQPIQSGYDMQEIVNALQRLVGVPLFCFLDACRIVDKGRRPGSYSSPWPVSGGDILWRPEIFLPGFEAVRTHCAKPDQMVGDDFTGGAIFSEAIRLALDRFGADRQSSDIGYAVYRDGIEKAVTKRTEHWMKRHRELEGTGGITIIPGNMKFDWPITLVEHPHGMIALKPPSGITKDYICPVDCPNGGELTPYRASDRWEADLAYGPGYTARRHQKRLGRAPKLLASTPFDVDSIYFEQGIG